MQDIDYPEHLDKATESLKIPPHSIEAEQSVLGGLMLDNAAWSMIADRITEKDFYRPEHQTLFYVIRQLCEEGQPCDIVTLSERLEHKAQFNTVGGMAYLVQLVESVPSIANITAYADIVRERSILRQLIRVGTDIANSAFHPQGQTSEQLLDQAERHVFAIAELGQRQKKGFREIRDVLTHALERIESMYQQQGGYTGVPTGFKDFDEKTSGLQRSDLIIVAGRPSMGKTSFAMNIAEHVALNEGLPVAVFSMEMPSEQLAIRLISSLSRIDQQRVRTGGLLDEDWARIVPTISQLSETKLFIDDTPALTPTELRARSRRLVQEHGQLGLILIDYLQLMQVSNNRESRAVEISEISRSLKALAKELNVPLIALSQLNRTLENRPNKRPVMSDLRESGAIEQDADVIVFIYRDEVYHEDSEDKGIAEIIIGKQRNGPIGTVRLAFLNSLTRFENLASPMYTGEDHYYTTSYNSDPF